MWLVSDQFYRQIIIIRNKGQFDNLQKMIKRTLRNRLIKDLECSYSQRQQGNQSHLQSQYSYFDQCEQQLSIKKTVFQKLISKHQGLIEQVLTMHNSQQQGTQFAQVKYLKEYLSKIQELSCIQTEFYNQATVGLTKIFIKKMACSWQNMKEDQKIWYQQVANSIYTMRQKKANGRLKAKQFSGYQMYKVDVIGAFLLYSRHYYRILKNIRPKIVLLDPMRKIFAKTDQIYALAKNFQIARDNLRFQYSQYIQEYFELFLLLKLGFILSQKLNKNEFYNIPTTLVPEKTQDMFHKEHNQEGLKFKFCEVAFLPFVKNMKKFSKSIKGVLINQQLQKNIRMNPGSQKQTLLRLVEQKNVPLPFLTAVASKIQNYEMNSANFRSNKLQKCQWVFLKGFHSLRGGINNILGEQIIKQQYLYSKGPAKYQIISVICKFAMKRFAQLSAVFRSQQKLQQKCSIYVCRFQYSLRDIVYSQDHLKSSGQQVLDERISLVMLADKSKIIAYSVYQKTLTEEMYQSIIKDCIKNIVLKLTKQFNLILYDFNYQKSIEWQILKPFRNFIKRSYGANTYMLNDPHFFQLQLIINTFLRSLFQKISQIRTNFHQIIQVCIVKLLNRIQSLGQVNLKDYFQYLDQKMSLPLNSSEIGNIYLKKTRNKYGTLILCTGNMQKKGQQLHPIPIGLNFTFVEQALASIRQCRPSLASFIEYYNREEKWRSILSEEQQNDITADKIETFLMSKHMKERDIKRILKDAVRYLLLYQSYFHELVGDDGHETKIEFQITEEFVFLKEFYQTQNQMIDSIFHYPQREEFIATQITVTNNQKKGKSRKRQKLQKKSKQQKQQKQCKIQVKQQ